MNMPLASMPKPMSSSDWAQSMGETPKFGGQPTLVRPSFFGPEIAENPKYADNFEQQLDVVRRALENSPDWGSSVVMQTRWRMGAMPSMEQRLDQRSYLESIRRRSWEEVDWFIRTYSPHFAAVVENENNNWNFFNGYQWSETELAALRIAKLVPHVSNYMARWGRTIFGEERGAETIYKMEPNDLAFKPVSDLYNQVVPKICRANEWEDRSAGGFKNYVTGGRCFASVRPDPYDPARGILMQNERPQEFLYDFENAKDGTLDGCHYLVRWAYHDLEQIIWQYPEWEQYLREYDFGKFSGYESILDFTTMQPKVQPPAHKRMIELPATYSQRPMYRHRRGAPITEVYRRNGTRQWTVRDANFNIDFDFPFDAPDQAAWFYRNLRDSYQARAVALTGRPALDLVIEPQPIVRETLDREFWCADVLLDVQTRRTSRFPYIAMHQEFVNGEWRGFFQDDKSNQVMRNRMNIYLDMMLGGVKGKTFYHEDLFPKGTTTSQMEEWVRDPNKVIISNWSKTADPARLHVRVEPPNLGVLPQVLRQWANEDSAFGNGGLNMIGDAEFAGQSERLRQGLHVAAQTGTVDLFSDWKRFERRVGQHVVYRAQFLHPTVLLGLADAEDRERFLPILQQESHSIELDQITMTVSEELAGPGKRMGQIATLRDLASQDPVINQAVTPEILRLQSLPQSMIDRIQANIGQAQQAAAEQAKAEQAQAEAEFQLKAETGLRRVAVEERGVAVKEHPPIATALTMKAGAPGPLAMAEIYEQHGIDADPNNVMISESVQDTKDQARDNVRQANFSAIDLKYQQGLAKIYPPGTSKTSGGSKGGKKSGQRSSGQSKGVRSPKDTSARSRKGAER